MTNPIQKLTSLGQSLWLDNIQRRMLENGELKAMIERGDIRGMTSNPTIFNNAIAKTNDYDSTIMPLAWAGWDAEQIFWQLAIEDIKAACQLFMPLYEETDGGDGYVSIEVSPTLANDTEKTIEQVRHLWETVQQPNLMVKIPATKEGIPAIRKGIAAGININITLVFSLARYAEVMEAYLGGLEDRLLAGGDIESIHSVASFFVSRVDTKIDPQLPADSPLAGKAGIANAKLAYDEFRKVFGGSRFAKLQLAKANLQRPLWASTSTKNPKYPDTLYADNLIGPATVDTIPPATLEAFRDHGTAKQTIMEGLDEARDVLAKLEADGISMDVVTHELELEGVKSFSDSFAQLLGTIEERRKNAASSLGPLADSVSKRIAQLEAESFSARLWAHDATLWTVDPKEQAEIKVRLGWLNSPDDAHKRLMGYQDFAGEIHKANIDRVLVLGMGGSSLTAEVFSSLLAGAKIDAPLSLAILDSTEPHQVAQAAKDYPPEKSIYIVASKSGGTAEVTAAFDYFWELSKKDGSRFVAITDPGTSLEMLARERGFRKIFSSDETVGGRFAALTDFGLVPAALLGMDLSRLLDRADWMKRQSLADVTAARNPGMALGAVIAESALNGRDKLTVVADAPVSALANWIEQIVAESSGKHERGILPVVLEPLGEAGDYGKDRLFVYLRRGGEQEAALKALRATGHPVIDFSIADAYDSGAEFYRWEIAIATACHILGVNAFDQPDVQESKDRTKAKIAEYQKSGKLNEEKLLELGEAGTALSDFLSKAKDGNYVAINAYLPRNKETIAALQKLRIAIRAETKTAVTAGFGPRFQHSTGQFHKGGPNKGLFIQIIADAEKDTDIPTEGLTFGNLVRAQALGDYETLISRGRQVLRIHLSKLTDLEKLTRLADTK